MRLVDLVREVTPKINQDIARGWACEEIAHGEEYIRSILVAASNSLPEDIEYVGPASISTREALDVFLKENRGGTKQSFEYARSNIYLMKCLFRYKGELLEPQYIGLPYVDDGALMRITGSLYSIAPQIADIAASVTSSEIHVPVTRDKLNFYRLNHPIKTNGLTTIGNVVWGRLYRDSKRQGGNSAKTVVLNTTALHYMLAKFGLTETAQRLGLGEMHVGSTHEERLKLDREEYRIFESSGQLPRGLKDCTMTTNIWIAFKKDENYNEAKIRDFVASLYYIIDHFPDRMTVNELDNPVRWLILLAHAIFANGEKESKLLDLVRNHINSIECYIDAETRKVFALGDLGHVNDIYDLMAEMINNYAKRRLEAAKTSTSLYDKHLLVNRKVFADIVSGIFKCVYALQQKVRQAQTKNVTLKPRDIEEILRKWLNSKTILQLNQSKHPEVEPVSCAGAYMAYKITTRLVLQSNVTNGKTSKTVFDPYTMRTDVSIAEVTTMLAPTKGEATGRGHLNLFATIDRATGRVIRNEKLRYITEKTQEALK